MTDAAPAGGSGARQLITLAGVALAAGAATAAASYWLLRVSDQQKHGPGEAAAQQHISSSQTQDAAVAQQHSHQQPAQRRRLAPQPLRSPFHNDKRCGGPGDPQSDDSMERCWEWLSQSEDGAPDVSFEIFFLVSGPANVIVVRCTSLALCSWPPAWVGHMMSYSGPCR